MGVQMIDRLFNDANVPLLEKMVRFTQARERVLANDIVNLSTPNYTPQDLSQDKFQDDSAASSRLRYRRRGPR